MVEAAESHRKLVRRVVLKLRRPLLPGIAIVMMIICCAAQSSGRSDKPAAEGRSHALPSPTNLKVLPKDLTGQQVHDIMKQWEADLGVRCDGCHKEDDVKLDPQGKPLLDFADDSKPMKNIARLMYIMTNDINRRYVANIEGSGLPVTCGTCHRGRIGPEPFTPPPPSSGQASNTARPSN